MRPWQFGRTAFFRRVDLRAVDMKNDTLKTDAHPVTCHICQHSAEVARMAERLREIEAEMERLADERKTWEAERDRLSSICGDCSPKDDWTHDGRTVSLDAMGGGDTVPAPRIGGEGAEESATLGALTPEEERGAVKVLRVLMGCDWRGILMVWGFLHQRTQTQVAKLVGISKQRFHHHFREALRGSPLLASLYYGMTRYAVEDEKPCREG